MSRIRLEIESELSSVGLMAMAVNKICAYYGMDELAAYQVELCVSEAATNAIRHAYKNCSGHAVSLLLTIEDDGLLLECSDSGTPMDPGLLCKGTDDLSDGVPQRGLLSEGGRGLQIIRAVMDEVSYSTNNGLNCLRMSKRLIRV